MLAFLFPFHLKGQNNNSPEQGKKEFNIVVSCVEYIGNGMFTAYFGYENPGNKTISVDESGSVVVYNKGQSKKYGIHTFLPGVYEKAFSQEFDSKDRVQWTVTLPNGQIRTTDADIHSNHCRDYLGLDIIPYYAPPEGGKIYHSKIGAELTSLYETYSRDPAGFTGVSDDIFQIRGTMVFIETVAHPGQY
ncbi:MAG TPA: hypothetical protein ENO20_01400, partial [Bacteroides sp.]|nr:hypothetical protein [Bacteroides sp.]